MPDLAVKIDGQYVPLTECEWVWREPCGCPFGVMSAATRYRVVAVDEDAAWREFYEHTPERDAARKQGVTAELMTHDRYGREVMPLMLSNCPHKAVA